MRLIDADKLSEEMYHEAFETDTNMQKWDSGCWIRYKMFENKIAEAPTVKQEPKTEHWILCTDDQRFHECSCCRYQTVFTTTYCSNCGARMEDIK